MRIISGIHKGRKINAPKNLPVRPTTDFAKEALFNILNNRYHFKNITVTDLFSGTGNIAFEFASRGVKKVIAIDENSNCIRFINKISEELDLPVSTIKSDVFQYFSATDSKTDIIFADPPYNFQAEALERLSSIVFEKNLLKEEGVLIIEHSKKIDLSGINLFSESRKYGNSVFSFFLPNLGR